MSVNNRIAHVFIINEKHITKCHIADDNNKKTLIDKEENTFDC